MSAKNVFILRMIYVKCIIYKHIIQYAILKRNINPIIQSIYMLCIKVEKLNVFEIDIDEKTVESINDVISIPFKDKFILFSNSKKILCLSKKNINTVKNISPKERLKILKNTFYDKIVLGIDVSDKCNFDCKYCSAGKKNYPNINIDSVINAIDYIVNNFKNKKISIEIGCYAEPTQNIYNLKRVIDHIKKYSNKDKNRIHVSMITNGYFSKSIAKYISEENYINNIIISFDGPPEIQTYTRPLITKENSNNIIEKNILYIANKQTKDFGINSVVTRFSLGKERYIFRYLIDNSIKNIYLSRIINIGNAQHNKDLQINYKDFYKFSNRMRELGSFFNVYIDDGYTHKLGNLLSSHCALFSHIYLSPNRILSHCPLFNPLHYDINNFKDIIGGKYDNDKIYLNNNFDDIWIKENSKCLSCDYFFLCGGGCPLRNLKENKDINIPDERHCNGIKTGIKEFLFYLTQRYLIKKKPYFLRENDGLHFSTIYSDFKLSENSIVKSSLIILNKNSNFDDIKEKIINEWNSNPKDFLIFFISVREKKEKIGNKILNFLDELSKKNIPFIISRPIPRCLFYSFDDFEKLKKFNNPESIYNSFEFYEVQNNGKIKFFDGSYGKNIEEYEDRNDIKNDFLNKKHDFIPDECKKCIYFKNDLCKMYNL